jgi:2-polyprenyl-3-methyl-5-hydroxy-6-metoxy-1,4-benzoquinol methylase
MTSTAPAPSASLADIVAPYPAVARIAEAVLKAWPEHEKYMARSLAGRGAPALETTALLADAAVILAGDRLDEIAQHYRWTCDRLREEEIHFHRNGAYRLKTFAEADAEVYSNADYMAKYVDGLLFSQVLWANHARSCDFYFRETPRHLRRSGRLLEVGPGHGLMLYLAMRDFGLTEATAWDLSAVSIDQTRHALDLLGVRDATLGVRDIMAIEPGSDTYDLVVLSEILEHLEDPKAAMRAVRGLVADDGLVFVNVPINSPSPDHLYLMESLDDARALLTDTGFDIVAEDAFATQNHPLDKALRNRISVSVCMLARPTGG